MLHAGLDLTRRKIDVCLLSEQGEHVDQLAVQPDVESLRNSPTIVTSGNSSGVAPNRAATRGASSLA